MTGKAHQLISIPDIDMASCHHVSDLEGSSLTAWIELFFSFLPPLSQPPTSHRVTLPHFGSHSSLSPTLTWCSLKLQTPRVLCTQDGVNWKPSTKKALSVWENIVLVMRRYYRMIHVRGLAKRKNREGKNDRWFIITKWHRSAAVSCIHLVSCPD